MSTIENAPGEQLAAADVDSTVSLPVQNGVGDIPKSIQQAYGLSRSGRR